MIINVLEMDLTGVSTSGKKIKRTRSMRLHAQQSITGIPATLAKNDYKLFREFYPVMRKKEFRRSPLSASELQMSNKWTTYNLRQEASFYRREATWIQNIHTIWRRLNAKRLREDFAWGGGLSVEFVKNLTKDGMAMPIEESPSALIWGKINNIEPEGVVQQVEPKNINMVNKYKTNFGKFDIITCLNFSLGRFFTKEDLFGYLYSVKNSLQKNTGMFICDVYANLEESPFAVAQDFEGWQHITEIVYDKTSRRGKDRQSFISKLPGQESGTFNVDRQFTRSLKFWTPREAVYAVRALGFRTVLVYYSRNINDYELAQDYKIGAPRLIKGFGHKLQVVALV